jgi:predicted nuclease with RNAse H fold
MVLKEEITDQFSLEFGLKHRFAAVDLAPNEQLESGFSVIDRERNLVRMDKLYRNEDIISAIEGLGPNNGTIVVIDMPKNLSIPGKWRQEQIKMRPLQSSHPNPRGETFSRFETRGVKLYDELEAKGITVFLYFNYWTRVNYDMLLPFRSRSPQGCRALQHALEHQLGIHHLPTNLAPSSVLESMVGAYAGWSIWSGQPGVDYQIYHDEAKHLILLPLKRPHQQKPATRKLYRRHRRFSRRTANTGEES